jgi:2-keto-4-pentenoate hydratase/2-oxohepta-3-ene-1,7-dioic acid hydratase in catechol pathway
VRLLRIGEFGAERPAVLHDGTLYDISGVVRDIDGAFFSGDGVSLVAAALAAGGLPVAGAGQRVGAPIARPGKVVCIGLNYTDHAAETNRPAPERPVVFMKDPATVIGPEDDVHIPRGSVKTDWELELSVVIGARARYLASPAEARAAIAGYALSNDVSERTFQMELSPQWDLGKSCERFNPLGPWLVTSDEIPDPHNLAMRLSVNGSKRQNSTTANMVFTVDHLVWYLSQYMVLEPGDLINTGTPAGVALSLPDHPYLRPGDRAEMEIEGLGQAAQTFVAAP